MIGERFVLCMRVQSDKPKHLASGETGWLHPTGEYRVPVVQEKPRPIINVGSIMEEWKKYRSDSISVLSSSLGVSGRSLEMLEAVRAPYKDTWGFPMRYGDNSYAGIRLRNLRGEKWAERGSHSGLFIPQCDHFKRVMIVEGPTDCAAALTLGFFSIGRPSCSGGVEHIRTFCKQRAINEAIIVADLDDPGLRGAIGLQELLPVRSCVLVCPAKDMRSYLNNGGNKETINAMINQLVWRNP